MAVPRSRDRFGNELTTGLPYARGQILATGALEHVKLQRARGYIAQHIKKDGQFGLFNLSGLERGMTVRGDEIYDDETTPAIHGAAVSRLAMEHLGGTPGKHDIALMNRQSAALFAALMVLIRPGDRVVGISADYTHPAVTRPVALLGGHFVDTVGLGPFEQALSHQPTRVVVMTRLAVSYRLMEQATIERVIAVARSNSAVILVDDAGGARVGPAVFGQPRLLQMDIDIGSTGLDKYGTVGPRLGLLGGNKDLVAQIRTRAFEYGLEARPMLYPAVLHSLERYRPERVLALRDCTARFAAELTALFGDIVQITPVSAQIRHEDVLALAMQRAGISDPPIVPYEATAAIAMLLLRDYGVLTVHFAGLPPGTAGLLFKFMSPEVMERFGGPGKLAAAVNSAIDQLSEMLTDPNTIRELLLGIDDPARV